MNDLKAIYRKRINMVIEYVDNHLSKPPSLDELASVACFSFFHFHRILMAITGETVNFFTNRVLVEKAAHLLTYSRTPVANIALNCSFSSSSIFSRSFKHLELCIPVKQSSIRLL